MTLTGHCSVKFDIRWAITVGVQTRCRIWWAAENSVSFTDWLFVPVNRWLPGTLRLVFWFCCSQFPLIVDSIDIPPLRLVLLNPTHLIALLLDLLLIIVCSHSFDRLLNCLFHWRLLFIVEPHWRPPLKAAPPYLLLFHWWLPFIVGEPWCIWLKEPHIVCYSPPVVGIIRDPDCLFGGD